MKYIKMESYLNFGSNHIKDLEFENRIKEYEDFFSREIAKKLSESFLKKYYDSHGFHDWKLVSIKECFHNDSVKVILYDEENSVEITIVYYDVNYFKTSFPENHFKSKMNNDFGIDEFAIVDDKHFSHEVFFPSGASYIVHFLNIEIV